MSLPPEQSITGSLLCGENAGEAISDHLAPPPPPPPPIFSDEDTIAALIDAETHHMPESDYLRRCRERAVDTTARLDGINWILKVHAFYEFRPVTAFLSVNYMDRFLSRSSLPRPSGWPFQLLSVACLSLAAKMEEPQVPPLMDLQLIEPKFVFEPKTIQRMELWVMVNLNWRLRSVTPFDYLDCFVGQLPSSSSSDPQPESMNRLMSTASDLILSTTQVIDFLRFSPSTVAAAAALCSAGHTQLPLCFHHRVNNEMVRCCQQLMEEYVVDTCPAYSHKGTRTQAAPPQSPVGVLDAATCGSCDTRSDRNNNNPGSSPEQAQAQIEIEPQNKRLRSSDSDVQQQ